jgi:hypothetical protein
VTVTGKRIDAGRSLLGQRSKGSDVLGGGLVIETQQSGSQGLFRLSGVRVIDDRLHLHFVGSGHLVLDVADGPAMVLRSASTDSSATTSASNAFWSSLGK